jgi:hypothetical protein
MEKKKKHRKHHFLTNAYEIQNICTQKTTEFAFFIKPVFYDCFLVFYHMPSKLALI